MEIEKKFLIRRMPDHLEQYEKRVIEQGYLCTDPVVRIRKSDDRYILTYKSRLGVEAGFEDAGAGENHQGVIVKDGRADPGRQNMAVKDGRADKNVRVNQEVEVPLNQASYEHLREKIDGYPVKKCRYLIPMEDGHTGELDVFEGVLSGLILMEIEFADLESAEQFVPPDWFGENVSNDYRYSNSFLSTCRDLTVFHR